MTEHFMGTHQNRRDAKGRVSIPSPFRHVLREFEGVKGRTLVFWPSHLYPCVEALPRPVFDTVTAPLQRLDLFSEPQDDMATLLFSLSCELEPDREGRVVLPDDLMEHAGIEGSMAFVGLGRGFQIWQPEALGARRAEARDRARANNFTLPATPVVVAAPARPGASA